ncbi:hypothetical protein DDE83_009222 [Stemphylium lycopersici]|uniref:Uncharacterized protein n=1 Tax=Stemphylium lycopersici TaxID=183478 RepID=A0A364MRL2_STELY|nr:hypothetical protein DDE83_009222 [Stemphylium lycopersici]
MLNVPLLNHTPVNISSVATTKPTA